MCTQVLSRRRIGPSLVTRTGCRGCSFQCTSSICWAIRCNGFAWIRKAVVDQMGSRSPRMTMTFFWCKFGIGKWFGASSQSSHWAGHHWLSYKIHFSSHHNPIEKWFVIITYNKRRWYFKTIFFCLWSGHKASTYPAFSPFQFASNVKWS